MTQEIVNKMIDEVLDTFDFESVHRVMTFLDKKWVLPNGEMKVPSTYQIVKQAENMLREVTKHYGEDDYATSTCGLIAGVGGSTIYLRFILEDAYSFEQDHI